MSTVNESGFEKRKYKNMEIIVKLFDKGRNLHKKYDLQSLIDIMTSVPFDKIPVAVNAYRNEYTDDINASGAFPVGYITGFDPETLECKLTILEKYTHRISQIENPIVYPRVRIYGNEVAGILAFDICSEDYYKVICK